MVVFKFLFFFLSVVTLHANSLIIDSKSTYYDLLPHSKIYIDKSKKLSLSQVQSKSNEFQDNDKKLLGYGYSPDFNVWVKFTLTNNSNNELEKVLEYDHALTTNIKFFYSDSNNKYIQDGLLNVNPKRKTLNPMFKIKLKPYETRTYYIQSSSQITTLIVKLNLWSTDLFYTKDTKHQFILALFFGAMVILGIYNIFIYFFTKDVSYLFYVLYIFGVVAHHLTYVGISSIYILDQTWMTLENKFASFVVAFPIISLALFCKSFLRTKQYPIFNNILNILLVLLPTILAFIMITDMFNKYRNMFSILLLMYLIILAIYASIKKNRQAYFILFGWTTIFTVFVFMYLSSTGIFNIYNYFPYIVELALLVEATIFSIALADRINQLQKDKTEANQKLITQQENEKQRLELQVENKTSDLKVALDEKGLLLKELNHRVKNNMQTIVSLISLQSDAIEDEQLQDIFLTAQNRIKAMSHLHELLYKQDSITNINAYDYFSILIEELKYSYDNDININFKIETQLKMEQAVYCGIIVNELVSNSFKYAFDNEEGNVHISLKKIDGNYVLCVSDDGKGYEPRESVNSLGLILVETLATKQLRADIQIDSINGVRVSISWESDIASS